MNQRNLERMADGLIHLRTELQRMLRAYVAVP